MYHYLNAPTATTIINSSFKTSITLFMTIHFVCYCGIIILCCLIFCVNTELNSNAVVCVDPIVVNLASFMDLSIP